MEMGDDPSDGNGTPKKFNLEPCGRWMLLRGFEYLFHMSSLCILPGMRIPHWLLYIYIIHSIYIYIYYIMVSFLGMGGWSHSVGEMWKPIATNTHFQPSFSWDMLYLPGSQVRNVLMTRAKKHEMFQCFGDLWSLGPKVCFDGHFNGENACLNPVANSPCFFHGLLKMVGTRGSLWASRAKAAMVCSFWFHFRLVLYWEVLGTISPSWVVGGVFGCKAWSSIALILGVDIALAHWAGLTFA